MPNELNVDRIAISANVLNSLSWWVFYFTPRMWVAASDNFFLVVLYHSLRINAIHLPRAELILIDENEHPFMEQNATRQMTRLKLDGNLRPLCEVLHVDSTGMASSVSGM